MEKNTVTNDKSYKPIFVQDEMSSSYLSYAMSVIVSRALPDVRDGLKPVHRRIIYAMYKGGYDWSKPFRKSARIVGDVIGKYHPHGDQSVYDALVRLVQDFSMSVPLISGQGNFGSIDGDPPAAMRYTETKLGKISQYLTEDLEKNTVLYRNNYDETEKEPEVLPSQYPNILVNGAGGIAVGMATSIPPHNLGEIIDGTIAYINNKDITIGQLMKHVPGPDFPTGGIIIGKDIIKQGYNKGRGSFKIRGEIDLEETKGSREKLIIKSIPYQVNKSLLIEKIAQLVRDKKIEGIRDIRDESNREGIRVVIELRKGIEPETIRRQLYKLTNIESSFGFNTLAIVNNKPKILNLKEFISEFLKFREDTVIKRVKFDLKKAEERAHILIGLATAVENIDEIIKIIKNSKDTEIAKKNLLSKKWKIKKSVKLISLIEKKKNITTYSLSAEQVNAILELRLQKLTAYGISEIESEINKLAELIIEYNKIINSKKELYKLITKELENIKDKFSSPRKTKIIDAVLNYNIEETIQKESVVISITNQGYIKRSPLSSLKAQKRGGKGKSGISTRDEDFVVQIFTANTHTPVLFFSTQGLVYKIKAHKIPEGTSIAKGKSIFNILTLKSHHSISSIMPLPEDEAEWKKLMIVFATSKGNVRKNTLEDFVNINNSGKIAMKLDQDDKIIGVKICKDDQDILLSTQYGKCIRFKSKRLRLFKGRSSKGIKGIQLNDKDKVISLSILDNTNIDSKTINKDKKIKSGINKFILSVTENGYGKRSSYLDYRVTNRGGKGIIGIINSPRNGNISSSLVVNETDEIILSTDKGSIMRCAVKEIRVAGRNTQGVRIKKLSGSEKVVSVIKIEDNIV
jgi:DNA gyrase subunit A